jgi:hypothetical protein
MRVLVICLVMAAAFVLPVLSFASWTGVDEAVVEKIAEEHGRAAAQPLINTDKGDLLLFVFLAAGALAGFGAGYWYRALNEKKGGR